MRNRTSLAVGLTIILALVSAACAETTSEPQRAPSELETLDEFIGWADFDEEAEHQAYVVLRSRIEGMLVECMADKGLEYAAREADPGSRPLFGEGLSDSEFRLQYGYGVFPGLLDEARWNSEHPPEDVGADPDVLWGDFTDDLDSYMVVLEECTVQVEEELGRPEPGLRETMSASIAEAWSPLEPLLEDMQRQMEEDSRLAEAEKGWSVCMDDKGFDFATDEDIDRYLMAKLGEFEEEANLGTIVLTAPFEKDIQPFIDEEMAVAAADGACRAELDRVRLQLQREYEGRFIDEHRDELEKIRQLEQRLMEVILEGWQW